MSQYQEHFRLLPWVYGEGCPVIIPEGVLLQDAAGQKLARVSLMNLDSRSVASAELEIQCVGPCGEDLGAVICAVEGLDAAAGAVFGGDYLIPDPATELMHAAVRAVRFADGSCWESKGGRWDPLPEPRAVEQLFQEPELAKEYKEAVGEPCLQAPRMYQGLFLCACGTINLDPDAPCRGCGRTFPELASAMNPEYLQARREERLAREAAQRQRAEAREAERKQLRREEAKQHRKEGGKFFLIALIAVVILGLLAWVIPTQVVPYVRFGQAYAEAEQLLEQEQYDMAHQSFAALGDYSDSVTMAQEALYRKAQALRAEGKYQEAIAQFEALGSYNDSAALVEETHAEWLEADYQAARDLVDAGAYPAAAIAFEALGDYKDAAQWVVECQMLQREDDYARANAAMEAGEYADAREIFLALGEYRESSRLAEECRSLKQAEDYVNGCAALDAGDYETAIALLEPLGSYEEAPDKLLEARYGNGLKLLAEEDYTGAIEELSLCGTYMSTDWNLKQAKMGYCRTHADRNDAKTLSYLKELKAIQFQGAKNLYDEIFGWKVEITSFSNKEWGEDQETLSKYGVLYVHFKLTGGEPGQSLVLRTVLTVPGGNRGTIYHNDVKDGYTGYSSFWFHDPDRAPTGTLTFQAYDEAGKLLCTGSVKVTK